jgi:hypothetical protein
VRTEIGRYEDIKKSEGKRRDTDQKDRLRDSNLERYREGEII